MKVFTNRFDVPLPLAVWLANDDYDYINEQNYISATSLMRPIRQTVLQGRIKPEQREPEDIMDRVASASGTAFHDSIEKAWTQNYKRNLKLLGFDDEQIDKVRINPSDGEAATPGLIPVYWEHRGIKEVEVDGVIYKVGGKFDLVAGGTVHDIKSTSTFAWTKGTRDDDFIQQGSIYRWIHPTKIKNGIIRILFIFTDWSKANIYQENYPPHRVAYKDLPLWTVLDTQNWVIDRIRTIAQQKQMKDEDLIRCTDDELWMTPTTHKYYSDPNKITGRSTKNFETLAEAEAHMEKTGKGVVITVEGKPRRCSFCPVFGICTQKDEYQHA